MCDDARIEALIESEHCSVQTGLMTLDFPSVADDLTYSQMVRSAFDEGIT